MFVTLSIVKILIAVCTLLLIGMMLIPAHALFLVVGGLTGLAGLVLLFFSPTIGLILIPTGGVMFAIGVGLRRRLERERTDDAEAARETSRRTSRMMDPYIPSDE
ncbi:unnamed protein product [marine sediment metagenome]|uniref:Uncharacterized protein n=1 Tax=marine sediment metagenome TaxID=412755 RepID=X0WBZ9_9ZZZZ